MISRRAAFFAMLAIILILGARLLSVSIAGIGAGQDICILQIGPDVMHFAAYQPGASGKKFCGDIPAIGKTIFVFDYEQPELREMKTDFRIGRLRREKANEAADNESVTVGYFPPAVYPNGTLGFEHVFAEPGNYVGIVAADGAHGEHWEARFLFSVAQHYYHLIPYYLLAAAAGLSLLLLFWKERPHAPSRSHHTRA